MKRFVSCSLVLFLSVSVLEAASREPSRGRQAMVASVSEIASRVGVDVMKKGGNAVDASVAVALTLAVTWPSAGNLAGGGFMLVRKADGTAEVIDYRERAPLAATRDMYLDAQRNVIPGASTLGYQAVAVPGTVAGLVLAHRRHGRLKWSELVEPARKLAADGFLVNIYLERSLSDEYNRKRLATFPETRRLYLNGGKGWHVGDRFRQPELAATLARMQKEGAKDFYRGETARLIIEDVKRNGGLLTADDLRQYEPTVRKPLRGTYRGYEILTMPPPSSGGAVLLEALNILERFDLASMGRSSSQSLHLIVEASRRAYADRAAFMADTDFEKVPIAGMIDKRYAAELARGIDPMKASDSSQVKAGNPQAFEKTETTHFSIVDAEGNAVSNTYTLNDSYGSAAVVKGAGFLLNNEMDDFTSKPGVPNIYGLIQSEANAIVPKKRPLSAMTPTLVLKDGKLFMAVGSPGGGSIISTVLHVILNVIDFGLNLQEAVDAPRFHHQWLPDVINWEKDGLNADTKVALETKGHVIREKSGYSSDWRFMGDVHAVMIESATGVRLGSSDPRRGGVAVGY